MIRFNPLRLLNSPGFGAVLIALTGAYVAMGYSRSRLLGLGSWLDKSDSQFFSAWPLKVLMLLLVANLVVVTWRRIPLTPSRYGAWCINTGIIALVCGSGLYFSLEMRGQVRIYADPLLGPTTADHFYDADQRSLYVRLRKAESPTMTQLIEIPLPALPRFAEYDQKHGNADVLASRGLNGIGLLVDGLTVDVIGFYPDAKAVTDFSSGPTTKPVVVTKSVNGAAGPMVKLNASMGNWSSVIYVPFAEFAADQLPQDNWHGGFVMPPKTSRELQFQLGDSTRQLPVRLGLDVPSTVVVTEAENRERYPDIQHINHAIGFDGGRWTFHYLRTDPSPDHLWIELAVANRPGIVIMVAGGVMICVGILYAIFVRPIIRRRMSIKPPLQLVQN
jgi:hypothetical protein